MQTQFKYFAFVSYSHKDSELAKWLQHEFEYYKLPSVINGRQLEEYKDLPKSFRPLFRDEDELAGGDLKPQIYEALANSQYLIVVCSPNSAQSKYVNDEIKEFISLSEDNKRKIFPFIVDGKPHAKKENDEKECFPKALLELNDDKSNPIELIAGDVNATGKDHAFVKILAGTIKEKGIQFSDLWDRYEVEKAENERKEREQRDKLFISQSRILSDKSAECMEQGDYYLARMLALRALPPQITDSIDRPYVPAAEKALRKSIMKDDFILRGNRGKVNCAVFGNTEPIIATGGEDSVVRVWDCMSGRLILESDTGRGLPISSVVFINNDKLLLVGFDKSKVPLKLDQIEKTGVMVFDITTEQFIYPGTFITADEMWVSEKYSICIVKLIDTIIGYDLSNYEKKWELKVLDTKSWNLYSSAFNTIFNRIVVATRTSAQVINAKNGDSIFKYVLNNPEKNHTCSDLSYDGVNLICGIGKRIEIFNIERNELVSQDQFEMDIKIIRSCHTNPYVVCVLEDNRVLLYDYINSQKTLLQNSSEKVSYVNIDKEDKYVAISSWNKTVRIVSLGANYSVIGKKERPNTLKETSTSYLVYGDNTLIDLSRDGRELLAKIEGISSHKLYNNGSTYYYTKGEYGQTSLVAYSNGNENVIINNLDIDWCSQHRTYSSFICFEDNSVLYCNLDRKIVYRDQSSTSQFVTAISYECFMRLSPNKDYVVIVASTEMIIFDLKSLSIRYRIKREDDINDISISTDDKYIVVGGKDSTMIILDAHTGEEYQNRKLGSAIYFAEFTPDNGKIILATENGAIHVFDMESNSIIQEIYDETKNYTLRGFTKEAISSDGKYLLTGQWNGSSALHVIDLSNFEVVATYGYHLDSIISAIFAENDRYIVTVSYDGQIIKNEFKSLQELIDENRLRFKDRSFTDIEKRKFYIE